MSYLVYKDVTVEGVTRRWFLQRFDSRQVCYTDAAKKAMVFQKKNRAKAAMRAVDHGSRCLHILEVIQE